MAGLNHHSSPSLNDMEKSDYTAQPAETVPVTSGHIHGVEYQDGTRLHRGLKARHITMIAIGGAIGKAPIQRG